MSSLQRSELRGVRVLVVDDDADNREMLTTILEHSGAIVMTAGSAEEAFGCFCESPPQVVVTDIGLPGEDGYSLMRRIRDLPNATGGYVPAIALSGYGREEEVASKGATFQAHLTKPVALDEMLAAVVRVLGSMAS